LGEGKHVWIRGGKGNERMSRRLNWLQSKQKKKKKKKKRKKKRKKCNGCGKKKKRNNKKEWRATCRDIKEIIGKGLAKIHSL